MIKYLNYFNSRISVEDFILVICHDSFFFTYHEKTDKLYNTFETNFRSVKYFKYLGESNPRSGFFYAFKRSSEIKIFHCIEELLQINQY